MEPTPVGPAPWREVFRGARGRLVVGLVLLETLVAVHILVVAAVMPSVLRDLGHLPLYGWSFTAAALAQFGAIPVAGAAVDRFGPRRVLLITATVYLTGLLISALAPTMQVLIAGRFLQGAAGGAGYALSLGAVAKTLPVEIRPRVLALLATAWLLPGLLGPPLGALLASTVGWRWAFIVPIPLLVARRRPRAPGVERHRRSGRAEAAGPSTDRPDARRGAPARRAERQRRPGRSRWSWSVGS